MSIQPINTNNAPQAIGPYNQALVVKDAGLVYTSGQLGLDPESGDLVTAEIVAQTEQALKNLRAVLEAAGSGLDKVIKTTVFLANMDDFSTVNRIYGQFFDSHQPARSAVQVARLPKDALIEIEAVACL